MRAILKTAVFLLPVALISTYLLTSPKKATTQCDLRDAVGASEQLADTAGPDVQPIPDQDIKPSVDIEATEAMGADEAKGRCGYNMAKYPGCPGYCKKYPAHSSCALPFHCRNNMQLYACKKHCEKYPTSQGCNGQKSAGQDFNEKLAKANCKTNPNAPGCPLYCKDHHSYPGCPMFCQLNPLHQACGHIPAYCGTNPNGHGCPKSVSIEVTKEDIEEAKGRCGYNNAKYPGCPGYCAKHPTHSSCALPFHCRNNMQLYACKKHCEKYPTSQGCGGNKSAEGEKNFDEELAKANCAAYPNAPGCPMYCRDHHAYPGCPLYCQLNPLSPACKNKK